MGDEELLARAEQALTEIKVNQGLSEHHAAVLAALRLRLKGSEDATLDEMLVAAEDPSASKPSLDDLLQQRPKPKPDWPG